MTATERQIADRRRQWAELSPALRVQRIQSAIISTLDHARMQRIQRRQHTRQRLAAQNTKVKEYERL